MMGVQTIHLTNASSRKLHHGSVYNIMAMPRGWEHFNGNVPAITPTMSWLAAVRRHACTVERYREKCEQKFADSLQSGILAPGRLLVRSFACPVLVRDGDTLVCACSREAAARGDCHRAWAAPFLARAGWRVVLDGVAIQ